MRTGVSPKRIATRSILLFSHCLVHVRLSAILRTRLLTTKQQSNPYFFLRKEVIQPHLPIRLPCYDFTPIIDPTFDCCPLTVSSRTLGIANSHGVTGGVYKARERIHRDILIRDY